jgi:hypothetical protein
MTRSSHTVAPKVPAQGHIGLVVLGSIAGGLAAGAVLDLLVVGGSTEAPITGMALLSLAFGFGLLALLSSWRTSQPQSWAIYPAVWIGVAGGVIALTDPSNRTLDLAGWIWPCLLLVLLIWMEHAARRALRNWSRLALLYPAFALLTLAAVGGAFETVAEATTSSSRPLSGHVYAVNGHSLYLSCSGRGTPTVVLFNGYGERASSWARVRPSIAGTTRVCTFDRAGEGLAVLPPAGKTATSLPPTFTHSLLRRACQAPMFSPGTQWEAHTRLSTRTSTRVRSRAWRSSTRRRPISSTCRTIRVSIPLGDACRHCSQRWHAPESHGSWVSATRER